MKGVVRGGDGVGDKGRVSQADARAVAAAA